MSPSGMAMSEAVSTISSDPDSPLAMPPGMISPDEAAIIACKVSGAGSVKKARLNIIPSIVTP